jgi:hypothetical protein
VQICREGANHKTLKNESNLDDTKAMVLMQEENTVAIWIAANQLQQLTSTQSVPRSKHTPSRL